MIISDFDQFTKDQELLISKGEVDYLEGFGSFRSNSSNISSHTIMDEQGWVNQRYQTHIIPFELALYYKDKSIVQKMLDQVLSQLRFTRSMVNVSNVSYFEFLNRVRAEEEEELRKRGLWEVAQHGSTYLCPGDNIRRFKDSLIKIISDGHNGGPIIIYPILRHKHALSNIF